MPDTPRHGREGALQLHREGAPQLQRDCTLARDAISVDARTVEIAFSSEAPVERWFGTEVLSHDRSAVRLERLNSARHPLLVNHDLRDQVGIVERAWVGDDRMARAIVRFGNSARAEEVFRDVRDGIRGLVSVGYSIHDMVLARENERGSEYLITDWEPLEVSLVPVPADPSVGVGRSAAGEGGNEPSQPSAPWRELLGRSRAPANPVSSQPLQEHSMPLSNPQASAAPAASSTTTTNIAAAPAAVAAIPDASTDDRATANATATAQGVASERTRVRDINALATRFGRNTEAAAAITAGTSYADFREQLLEVVERGAAPPRLADPVEVGLDRADVQRFSFLRLLHAMANPSDRAAQSAAGFEFEACAAARARSRERQGGQGLTIPPEILLEPLRREMNTGAAAAGGALVGTNLLTSSFIDILRNRMVIQRMGARVLTGLVGNLEIPRQSGASTAYWVAEREDVGETEIATDQVPLSPKTVGAYTDLSRRLLLQSSVDVEAMVRADLATSVALEIDRVALYGIGGAKVPSGLKTEPGVAAVPFVAATPSYAEIVELETAVAVANADVGGLAYLVSARGRGALKTTPKDAGSGQFVWESGNTVNGYRAEASNQVSPADYWFGNWGDLLIGFWSGLDVLVDPYSKSKSGTVRVVTLQDCDTAVRHGASFSRGAKAPGP